MDLSQNLFSKDDESQIYSDYEADIQTKAVFTIQKNQRYENFSQKNRDGWNFLEKCKFYIFLKSFQNQIIEATSKKLWKIYDLLARYVGTRNANQCRIHHNKLNNYFNSTAKIISFYGEKFKRIDQKHLDCGEQIQILRQYYQTNKNAKYLTFKQQKINGEISRTLGASEVKIEEEYAFEKEKQNNRRTDQTYREDRLDLPDKQSKNVGKIQSMPDFQGGQMDNEFNFHNIGPPLPFQSFSMMPPPVMMQSDKEREWRECQFLFQAYVTKLHKLINKNDQ